MLYAHCVSFGGSGLVPRVGWQPAASFGWDICAFQPIGSLDWTGSEPLRQVWPGADDAQRFCTRPERAGVPLCVLLSPPLSVSLGCRTLCLTEYRRLRLDGCETAGLTAARGGEPRIQWLSRAELHDDRLRPAGLRW